MLLFQKLVDETQMPKPQERTDIFILTKKLFLDDLRVLQSISNPVERPCSFLRQSKKCERFSCNFIISSLFFQVPEWST